MEDPLPPGQVSLMKEKFSGVGGETLKYVPRDDWDPRKSTEERLGWSNHKLHPLSTREQVVGRDAVGLPKWVRLEKQVPMYDLNSSQIFLKSSNYSFIPFDRLI